MSIAGLAPREFGAVEHGSIAASAASVRQGDMSQPVMCEHALNSGLMDREPA